MIQGDSDIIGILIRGRQEGCSQKMRSGGRKDAMLLALMMEDEATGQGPQVPTSRSWKRWETGGRNQLVFRLSQVVL